MNFTEFLSAGPEKVFRALVDLRTRAYAAGLLETVRLPVPVFCIGNLTVGGTGKTPGVVWLASYLREKGRRPAVLTRGYGRKSKDGLAVVEGLHDPRQVGDEPLFLARRLSGVPVLVGADRARSGQVAIEEFSADCLVLDDGYQHLRLHRDLNLLCLDAVREAPAFLDRIERLLPAGRLREPLAAMKRAGVIFLTKYNFADPETADRLRRDVERRLPGTPVVPVRYELAIVDPLAGNSVVDVSGQSVVALSGLASPWTFEEGLRRKGAQVAPLRFPDHHFFSERDRREALDRAAACGARVIVTEKDYQRLPKDFPCWVARLEWIPEQEKDRAWTEKIDSVIS